jgi:spermidine synthase
VYICLLEKCGIVIICRSVRIAHMTTANREAPYVFSDVEYYVEFVNDYYRSFIFFVNDYYR